MPTVNSLRDLHTRTLEKNRQAHQSYVEVLKTGGVSDREWKALLRSVAVEKKVYQALINAITAG